MTSSDTTWFTDARFGLFVHWGLYALPARHEWMQKREEIHPDDYARYADYFDPDRFDPVAWAEEAWNAGMRYTVITTKHHEGFALWDSTVTEFKATNTPAGRDLLREFVDAFRARGFRIGLYHSLIDWHHPEFPVDCIHPMHANEEFKAKEAGRDITAYADCLHAQVRELLTGYGRIDILWFDFSYAGRPNAWGGKGKDDWRSEELLAMARELQPGILVNDRLDVPGDFTTPEQFQPSGPLLQDGSPVVWEACQTINGSWGYDRDNRAFKSPELLVRMLIDGVSKGGNLLLNVGPNGRGDLDPASVERLRAVADWMALHERAVRGAGPSTHPAPADCRYTQRGNRLYLHLFTWPLRHVHLAGLAGKVAYAQLLHDASEVRFQERDDSDSAHSNLEDPTLAALGHTVTLTLPDHRPDAVVPVVEIFLRD